MADNYLCEDLIVDIFKRLPAKSLLRFRSLSKSWCSRIASPSFIRKYTHRSQETSSFKVLIRHVGWSEFGDFEDLYGLHSEDRLLTCDGTRYIDISTVDFPCIDSNSVLDIVNSCNGIFCLCDRNNFRISLWNPSIRCKVRLPCHPCFQSNPRNFSTAVGLGFDPITDDYKIVRISNYDENKEAEASSFVYSMKTRSWRGIASPAYSFQLIWLDACFFNVALHWVARYLSDFFIMTFNLSTQVFGKVTLPKPSWDTEKPTVINGCLAVMSYESEFSCWIWVMKEYNNAASWYVLFKVVTDPELGGMKGVLQLTTNRYFLINTYLGGIEIYDRVTRVVRSVFKGSFSKVEMATCLESIELLDRGERD